MKRLIFLIAFAAGYVAGSAAGRERYEQIRRTALRIKDDPRVQEAAHEAATKATAKAQEAAHAAKDFAADHLPGNNGHDSTEPQMAGQAGIHL